MPIALIKPFNAPNNFPISDTNFIIVQAAKKPSIAYVIFLISSLFSLIQSENFFNASVSNFSALIIISPVHSPTGCKKLFHNHSPTGSKASITAHRVSSAAAISSNTPGRACSKPHFVIGSRTLFKSHSSKFPIALTTGFTDVSTLSKDFSSGEKSKFAAQFLILSDAVRKNPDNVTKISPIWRNIFVPVSPDFQALSNCVIRLATVCTRLANVISRLSVMVFPYPSTFQTCMNDAPTSFASCFADVNRFVRDCITSGPLSSQDSFSGANRPENIFFTASARAFMSFDTSSVVNI